MVWRYRWSLPCLRPNRIITVMPSIHYLPSRTACITYKTQKDVRESLGTDFYKKSRITLTHQAVYSTLLNCPSDLSALSFFLWCAKQPNFFHDHLAFNYMVGVVKRIMEQCKTVKGVLLELEKVGYIAKAQTFLMLLRIYWHGGMKGMVFDAFEQMCSHGFTPNTFACNAIMDVLFKSGSVDAAVRVLKETKAPNFLTFNIALCNLCHLNDLFLIGDAFRMMLKMGYYPNFDTFEMVLKSFCKMGKLAQAYQVLALMVVSGVPLTVKVWSILIDGFCWLRKLDLACNFLGKMIEAGLSPTVVTYTSLIKGFLKSHRVSDALDILHKMESRGCSGDLVLCNVLIDGLAKVGRHNDAINVFIGMVKRNIAPDSYTFCSLLSAICMSRRFSLFPKLVCGHLIEADLKVINSLFIGLIKQNIAPDSYTLCSLLSAMCMSRRFSLITELVCGHLIEADLKVYNSLLNYFCKAGFQSHALDLYNHMVDIGLTPDKYTFAGLLSGLCGAGEINQAIDVYRGIVKIYPCQDPYIHTVVIHGLVMVGIFHRAIGLFRKAVADGHPLDVVSYTVAINGLFKAGRTGEACSLFNQMKKVGLSPNTYTYNVMLSGLLKERDVQMVKQMLQEMIDAMIDLNSNNSSRLFNFLCRSYHYHSFVGLLVEMRDLGLMPAKAKCVLLLDCLGQGVKLEDESSSSLITYVENNLLVDTSSSEDLSDMAASVG
ncbi:putative pentatricopeptide repeat-containing protein At1g16830 [Ziziphus jujuba]|uniref:Pentatricopeptide repeat-containing protein At1g16830 n=1 Tax=Ziziphus jujuba TaxID=326968 RepID=A0A6P6GK89_ZIZJJ|nr:putative pentatricopeptide repeat-containing protein At1g16830 [Ziziphus jujuba]XP_024934225.2 putative pentatricopeptide repeat-containing protein At1g16830 [Ziziphus jujuba]XP_048318503.2 putative pentatricopeptide repeat-containing protein At1g16830 [Ziziphus jujuba]XP_048318504.2 putative pentatricopeptide repeat-containing protein At1g16830 [Ziziphus jujuba]